MGSRATVPAAATAAVLAALGISTHAKADVILDQSNTDTSMTFSSLYTWQQEIIAGVDGTLDSIDLYLSGSGSVDVAIYAGAEPWSLGTPAFTGSVVVDGLDGYNVDLSSAGIPVLEGESFVLQLSSDAPAIGYWASHHPGDDYAGDLWLDWNNGPISYDDLGGPGYDLGFQTYVTTPAPGALALFGFAGIGGGLRRRRHG